MTRQTELVTPFTWGRKDSVIMATFTAVSVTALRDTPTARRYRAGKH
jgi:hypothetical protein